MTNNNLLLAEKVFFESMHINDYPKHRVIINSLDIVQMIAKGIELALNQYNKETIEIMKKE
jgi:hypothetical protein